MAGELVKMKKEINKKADYKCKQLRSHNKELVDHMASIGEFGSLNVAPDRSALSRPVRFCWIRITQIACRLNGDEIKLWREKKN